MTVGLLIGGFILFLMLGVPVVWAMAAATISALVGGDLTLPPSWLAQQMLRGADSIPLSAIPLFLLAGGLMNHGGLTRRIIRVAEDVFGRLRGGLGLVNVATALIYGGISGSATADTGAVAAIMIPAMEERGYPRDFSAAVTAASGTLGIIVPPSIVMILYGVLTNTSIGGLFLAGAVPGVFIAAIFMVTCYLIGWRRDFPRLERRTRLAELASNVAGALPALIMPALILGAIVGGLATATEAAALAVVYAFLVGLLVYRELPFGKLYEVAREALTTTGAIMIIMAVATPFAWILTVERVPMEAASLIVGLHAAPPLTIALVLLLLKIVGFWLDLGPALIILAPILHPIALAAGFGEYQTGLLFITTLGTGLFTPPIGTNIFVVCNIARIDMWSVSRRLVPFWIASVVCVIGARRLPRPHRMAAEASRLLEYRRMGHLVGGISSAGRALPDLDGEPFRVARSRGAHVWDRQGRRYVDTALGFGATLLGHGDPAVMRAVAQALDNGPLPAFAHPTEEAAAAALAALTAPLDQVIFTNSGSEAVHLACRAARAVTGRTRVAKFAAAYDGWYDELAFGNAGSDEAAMTANRRPMGLRTVLLRYNDESDVDSLFAEHDDIAAVLVEPVLANAGCILPAPGYLGHLQAVARRRGALVILDEVLMGYRLHAGTRPHRRSASIPILQP